MHKPVIGLNYEELLDDITCSSIVDKNALIILEQDQKADVVANINDFTVYKQAKYGRIKILYYRR